MTDEPNQYQPRFSFDNTYVRDLPGFYIPWSPDQIAEPRLLYLNRVLADRLGLDLNADDTAVLAALFSGNPLPEGAEPVAQVYAGHQFGQFSPRLGDGRALLLGELVDSQGKRYDISFKGSGRTPYSRGGDGKAAVGPMLREVLIGEAMHALGIATTRSLAVVKTGEPVYRDSVLPGAILTRIAASHIRVGTFEYFAARGEYERVKQLADYAIARHDPALSRVENPYRAFLAAVIERQAILVADWMSLGFIHGVMNTDNMSIAGETIDYGPCAFMEAYDPDAVFSSIDQMGRYAYKNQPHIALWNLTRLAETLLPLLADERELAMNLALEVLDTFPETYRSHWLERMYAKLGWTGMDRGYDTEADNALLEAWLSLLQTNRVDFTLAWRRLADAAEGQLQPLRDLFQERQAIDDWLIQWQARCALEAAGMGMGASHLGDPRQTRAQAMRKVNPWIIPRNHRVEDALTAASDQGNLEPFEALLQALKQPYDENPAFSRFAEPAPDTFTASYRTFCGT